MGNLKIAKDKSKKKDGYYKTKYKGNYTNKDAPKKLINYVTRTGKREDRKEDLIIWGARGVLYSQPIDDIIHIIEQTQMICRGSRPMGPRMFHEIYGLSDGQMYFFHYYPQLLDEFAYACAGVYYDAGHQVIYGVHNEPYSEKRMHIHFAVNAVNYNDGYKWHTNMSTDQRTRENYMNMIFEDMLRRYGFISIQKLAPDNCI